jgi:tRNA-dihydrouridine synthase B
MRKFGIKYSRLHPHALEVRDAFIAVSHNEQLQQVMDRWYSEDLPGRYPPDSPDEQPSETSCEG